MYAFFGDFTHCAKAEDLKATRVGQDWLVPVHEFMQAAELIVKSALKRHESRGLHFTLDYPETDPVAKDTVLVP